MNYCKQTDGNLAALNAYMKEQDKLERRQEQEAETRKRLVSLLGLTTGSLSDGRAVAAEALTDCDAANSTLRSIASFVQAAVRDDTDLFDMEIGRIVREAVISYGQRVLENNS